MEKDKKIKLYHGSHNKEIIMQYGLGNEEIICFHNPDESNGYLSNWYVSQFYLDGISYTSAEKYMMYQKAVLFGDMATVVKIRNTNDVGEIKAYGRRILPYDDKKWSEQRYQVVHKGVLEKFRQNEQLAEQLLKTEDAILAECAVKDLIWGIGISMKDERRMNISEWKGLNLLGDILMQVRMELQNEQQSS